MTIRGVDGLGAKITRTKYKMMLPRRASLDETDRGRTVP
jgi:hypothetical protein